MRYFICLSYNGAEFHGWQIQPNAMTIQQKIQQGLKILLKEKITLYGAGRTDAGVHAKQMYAHFDTLIVFESENLCFRLNSFLPDSICIKSIFPVLNYNHARFDAKLRTYEYWICSYKNPFLKGRAWFLYKDLDYDLMNQASKYLLKVNDFTSFSKFHTQVKNNFCNVQRALWEQKDDKWVFTIEANRFLRNMVRAIVGSLVDVGKGVTSIEQFKTIVEQKDRSLAGISAPPEGLYLIKIYYSNDIINGN